MEANKASLSPANHSDVRGDDYKPRFDGAYVSGVVEQYKVGLFRSDMFVRIHYEFLQDGKFYSIAIASENHTMQRNIPLRLVWI